MKEKTQPKTEQLDLLRAELSSIINPKHELCLLADAINWNKFETDFAGYFPAIDGRPALSTRVVVGILYLQHAFKLSHV